jgi:hypothetical protein
VPKKHPVRFEVGDAVCVRWKGKEYEGEVVRVEADPNEVDEPVYYVRVAAIKRVVGVVGGEVRKR